MARQFADEAVAQLGALLSEYSSRITDMHSGYGPIIGGTEVEQGAACTRLAAAIDRWTRSGSPYREEVQRIHDSGHHASKRAVHLMGVAEALRDGWATGQMRSVEELVHADLFSDFLSMAKELLDKGFKDPAAVVAGSVLEGHLRQLAARSGIAVDNADGKPRKAEALNAELGKQVYASAEQTAVTAWLAVRNDAAHPGEKKPEASQVALMIEWVRAFTQRHPA